MPKTSVYVDRDIAAQAAAILGTTTLRDTIDAALREIVDAKRRLELVALLSEPGGSISKPPTQPLSLGG